MNENRSPKMEEGSVVCVCTCRETREGGRQHQPFSNPRGTLSDALRRIEEDSRRYPYDYSTRPY